MFGLSEGDVFSTERVEELNTKRISTNFIKWCTIREYINLKRDVSVGFLMKMPKSLKYVKLIYFLVVLLLPCGKCYNLFIFNLIMGSYGLNISFASK